MRGDGAVVRMKEGCPVHPVGGEAGGSDVGADVAVAVAYSHVAAGYEEALKVIGLPQEEADGLRACLRAARQLALQPPLSLVQSPDGGLQRSQVAG